MKENDKKEDGIKDRLMRSKTDQRYWMDRLKKRIRVVNGAKVVDANFSVQIAYAGKKERVNLSAANKSEAAARAASFYRSLVSAGWDEAYSSHKFTKAGKRGSSEAVVEEIQIPSNTLGDLFAAYDKVANPRDSTLSSYKKALRKIYSEIGEVSGAGRFKTAATGNRVWKEKVDKLPLSLVTSDTLLEWKQRHLGRNDCTLDEKRARAITLNSLLRNARSIFAKKHRALLSKYVILPNPVPFDEVRLEYAPIPRYRSRIDARAILKSADEELRELQPVLYAVLSLALRSGLRRREIDTLAWKSLDLERKVIHVEPNEHYDLKSFDSADEVDIGDEFVKFLTAYRKQHLSESFVIPALVKRRKRRTHNAAENSKSGPQGGGGEPERFSTPESYRCYKVFDELITWLRDHGVESKRPIHELRKEVGSLIADEHGIYAASRFMRHADIRITAASYLDKKKRIVAPF